MKPPIKFAWIIPKRLGDALFLTPSIRLVFHTYSQPIIDIISFSEISREVFMHSPYVNELFLNPSDEWLQSRQGYYHRVICSTKILEGYRCIKQLFTLSFCLGSTGESHAEKHVSASFLNCTKEAFQIKSTDYDFSYDLFPQKDHFNKVNLRIRKSVDPVKYKFKVGFHLGCHSVAKKSFWSPLKHEKVWEYSKALEFCQLLYRKYPECAIIITGSESEQRISRRLQKECGSVFNWVGKTSVLELTALMNYLDAYICPDTGPMHVACSTKVSTIGLFGATDPDTTGPYPGRKNFKVIKKNYMSEIQPKEVLDTLCEMLQDLVT